MPRGLGSPALAGVLVLHHLLPGREGGGAFEITWVYELCFVNLWGEGVGSWIPCRAHFGYRARQTNISMIFVNI